MVAADDRTGAFEVAGLLAAMIGPVRVTVGEAPAGSGVVDLGSRALSTTEAMARAVSVDERPSSWVAHKIDSTLRGNWAAELLARQAASGRRVVVLPGWPELGRTCVDGLVRAHGESFGRPIDRLPGADSICGATALREWLSHDRKVAVCDVPDTATMHALVEVLAAVDVLVAGPGGPVGAAFAVHSGASADPSPSPVLGGAIAVVCGSANAVSHEQVRRLSIARPDITVTMVPKAQGTLQPDVAASLAARAAQWIANAHLDTLVVIGGDTAAALFGDAPRMVGGFVAPGMPWSRDDTDGGPMVVTKAGGFGGPDALVELLGRKTV